MPARRLDTDTASTNPTTTPITILAASVRTKSAISCVYEAWPLTTMPATASAKMAPVGSLNADSAITVCDTLGWMFMRENRGIRMAGSVASEHSTHQQGCVCRQPEHERRSGGDHGGHQHPRQHEHSEASRDFPQHVQREAKPSVEQDERDADGENELGAK